MRRFEILRVKLSVNFYFYFESALNFVDTSPMPVRQHPQELPNERCEEEAEGEAYPGGDIVKAFCLYFFKISSCGEVCTLDTCYYIYIYVSHTRQKIFAHHH